MQLNKHHRMLLRGASRLQRCYEQRHTAAQRSRIESLQTVIGAYLDFACKQEHLLCVAIDRGMPAAVKAVSSRYDRAIGDLFRVIEGIKHRRQFNEPSLVPSPHDLYQELLAAEDEFDLVEVNLRERRISVITEHIALEGVALGRFRIDLLLDGLAGTYTSDFFGVEALDPNPPPTNDEVTHPHVEAGRLCAGNAIDAIEQALSQGRISEFFLLVRSVLRTYNPNSPYVELERWDGVSCHECGYVTDSECVIYCNSCDRDHCEECSDRCSECGNWLCRGCLSRSELSESFICEPCSAKCAECGGLAAKSELTEEVCNFCREQLQPSDQDEKDHHAPAPAPGINNNHQEVPAIAEPVETIAPPATQAA